jgi:hypothetical protein
MESTQNITCSVVSDLMILYTRRRTSAETNEMIHAHLGSCAACSRAFGLEPGIRGKVDLAPKPDPAPEPEDFFDQARSVALPAWGFILYLATRLLALLERLLARFGVSTTNAKIRLYRARRRLAGKLGLPSANEGAVA